MKGAWNRECFLDKQSFTKVDFIFHACTTGPPLLLIPSHIFQNPLKIFKTLRNCPPLTKMGKTLSFFVLKRGSKRGKNFMKASQLLFRFLICCFQHAIRLSLFNLKPLSDAI